MGLKGAAGRGMALALLCAVRKTVSCCVQSIVPTLAPVAAALAAALGCAAPVSEARPLEAPSDRSRPPIPSADALGLDGQLEIGHDVFIDRCSGCHGRSDDDNVAPPLLGYRALPLEPPAGARLRDVLFVTAADVVDWVAEYMPRDAPESLSRREYLAVVAYILEHRNIDLGGEPLSPSRAEALAINTTAPVQPE